ncbi:MAG: peroxide stress protein YaaA [Gammaproteobacteria bacterium]|nr:peroxide stress protein YaaA [Gammaproteobacteria bacterium]
MANLILTICSNHKRLKGAVSQYDSSARKITDVLPDDMGEKIIDARKRAFEHIKTQAKRDGKRLADMEYNKDLVKGPDIDPQHATKRTAFYVPAIKQYDGRFFKNFHDVVGDGCDYGCLGGATENHLLIVSGLYGLLTPTEPIQRYNCDIPDVPEIKWIWKEESLLTNLLISYMKTSGVNRVFDFMADDSYRHLVEWEEIKSQTGCDIFYSRSKQQEGVDILPQLGHVAGLFLTGTAKKELSGIKPNDSEMEISFSTTPLPWIPAGVVLLRRARCLEWAIRMTLNIETLLNEANVPHNDSLSERIKKLRFDEKDRPIGSALRSINSFRNKIVHDVAYLPKPHKILDVRMKYRKVSEWAHEKGYGKAKMEDVDI